MQHLQFRRSRIRVLAALSILAVFSSSTWAMRYAPAEVRLDGVVILEIGGGDDGHLNADEVWAKLKDTVFIPTEAFKNLKIGPNVDTVTLGERGDADSKPRIVIDSRYGGRRTLWTLRLIRSHQEDGPEWMIHPDDLDDEFGHRDIMREQADFLPILEFNKERGVKKQQQAPPLFEDLTSIRRPPVLVMTGMLLTFFCAGVFFREIVRRLAFWTQKYHSWKQMPTHQ